MIRGTWKARDNQSAGHDMDVEDSDEDEDSMDEEMLSTGTVKNNVVQTRKAMNGTSKKTNAQQCPQTSNTSKTATASNTELDDLAGSMNSLSLVPSNIRFGRGGRNVRMARQSGVKDGKWTRNS